MYPLNNSEMIYGIFMPWSYEKASILEDPFFSDFHLSEMNNAIEH